jgi:ribosomal protein S4
MNLSAPSECVASLKFQQMNLKHRQFIKHGKVKVNEKFEKKEEESN